METPLYCTVLYSTSAVRDCPELTFKFMSNAPVTESKGPSWMDPTKPSFLAFECPKLDAHIFTRALTLHPHP